MVLELQKGGHYWEAGKAAKQVGFFIEGVIRVYYYKNKGEEITRYFVDENLWDLAVWACVFPALPKEKSRFN